MSAQTGSKGYQELNQTNLQNAIDTQFGTGKAKVIDNGDGTFTVSFIDSKKDYNITSNGVEKGINWNEAMKNAEAPSSQDEERNNGVIGIGTDGNPVDMDLWEYTQLSDNTYALNDLDALNDTVKTPGYKFGDNGENVIDGKIIGTVPQYISTDNGKNFYPVTDLTCTFSENSYLVHAPYIPLTVKNMAKTFIRCSNLEAIENFPPSLTDINSAFKSTKIRSVPYFPDTIKNMSGAFQYCTELSYIENIPKYVETMSQTFVQCNFSTLNVEIPNTVTDIYMCFAKCKKLNGTIIVRANISGAKIGTRLDYGGCFGNVAISGNGTLTLKCSENVYNLFYDGNRPNKMKQGLADYNADIVLEKI